MDAGNEICAMDAVQIADAVRARTLSPVEIIDAVLERMNRVEPHLHAFCTPTPELARAEAKRIEAEISAGRDAGPLAGVPVSIKDLIFTRGIRTTSGSVAYREFVPDEDDIAVERLRAAGAIIIGKTNTAEFGYSATGHNPLFETTRNPWNLAMTPGGSSAGAGAAVAAGVGPLALGSDGGGSVRIPASFCGLYGIKPSFGRIPLYPGSRDEGIDWRGCVRAQDLRGMRVAYSADWGYAAVDPEVAQIARDAARVFERDLGCIVEDAHPGWSDPAAVFAATMIAETDLRGMRGMVAEHGAQMSSHMVDLIMRPWSAEELTDANIGRKAVANHMARLMAKYDLLLTPTACVPPFPLLMQGPDKIAGRYVRPESFLAFTIIANLTGQPAASVPAGFTKDGLPVGLQIIGRHLDDAMVLRASAAFEAARPWAHRWPPLLERL
ncbi:MAG: amidase [Candidatus Binataceae bacterium]